MRITWFVPPAIATLAQVRASSLAGPVQVEATQTTSSDAQFEALTRGEMDLAVTAMDNVIAWNRRGEGWDFRILAQVEQTTSLSVIARPEVTSAADLAGRTVLVDSAENGFVIALLAWMADAGLKASTVRLTEAGGVKERFQKLLDGDGAATLLGPPFDGQALGQGMRALASLNAAYPQFPGQALVARRSALSRIGPELEAWLATLEDARLSATADPERARDDLLRAGLPRPAAELLAATVPRTLRPDRAGVELVIAQRARLGRPGGDESWAGLIDEGTLTAALTRRPAAHVTP